MVVEITSAQMLCTWIMRRASLRHYFKFLVLLFSVILVYANIEREKHNRCIRVSMNTTKRWKMGVETAPSFWTLSSADA